MRHFLEIVSVLPAWIIVGREEKVGPQLAFLCKVTKDGLGSHVRFFSPNPINDRKKIHLKLISQQQKCKIKVQLA